MALERHLTSADRLFIGDDIRLEFPVYDQTGLTDDELEAEIAAGTATPVDVSAWDLSFMVRLKDKSDDPALIEKTTGSPGGITIVGSFNPSQASNTQRVRVAIDDVDTWDPDASPAVEFVPKKYRYALKRMDAGSEKVLVFGNFQLLQATTR